jgi:hypothetical protein
MPTDEAAGTGVEPAPFPYLRWAKAHLEWDPLCLGMSGLAPLTAQERADLGLSAPTDIGQPEALLKEALAERHGLPPEAVHPAAGTSHANFIVYLALARGGRVAVETPGYEALGRLAEAVGAEGRTFRRDPARAWRVDPDDLAAAVAGGVDLIVVTDLHNPSGARLAEEDLDLLVVTARRAGAHLLVDEVYADFDPRERPTAARRDPLVLATGSLTKAHGLPDLRAGWVLGAPEVVARVEAWDDLVHPSQPPAGMADAARYVPQARARMVPVRALAAERAAQVDAWVRTVPGVTWEPPDGGLSGFLHLGTRDGDAVAERAWRAHGVRVVPGSFFQDRNALRISFLRPRADLARALEGLRRALEDGA